MPCVDSSSPVEEPASSYYGSPRYGSLLSVSDCSRLTGGNALGTGKKRTTGSVFELLEEADRQQNARSLRKAGHKKGMTPPQPGRSARKNQKRRAKKQAAEAKAAAEKAQAIAEAAAAAQDVVPEPVPRVPAAIAAAAAAGAPQVPARGPNTSRRPGAGAPNPAVPARAVGGPAGAGGSTPAAPVASAPAALGGGAPNDNVMALMTQVWCAHGCGAACAAVAFTVCCGPVAGKQGCADPDVDAGE